MSVFIQQAMGRLTQNSFEHNQSARAGIGMKPIQRGGLRQIDVFSQWTSEGRRLEQTMSKIVMAEQLKNIDIWDETKLLSEGGNW